MASFEVGGQGAFNRMASEGRALCAHRLDNSAIAGGPIPSSNDSPSNSITSVVDAPQASTADSVLTIRAQFPRPLAWAHYWLLRDDPTTALTKEGIRVPSGVSADQTMVAICGGNETECKKVTLALDAYGSAKLYGDTNGNGTFRSVASGVYFLVVSAVYANSLHVWNQRVDLKAGRISMTVTGK